MTRPLEILAPGGSVQAAAAAAHAGADAVYMGVGALNARVRAANLDLDELPSMTGFLHAQGLRLYVTLNLPLTPETLDETLKTLAACYLAGVDAVILRDPWLAAFAKRHLPKLPLHASTQAGISTPDGARRARDLGYSRVILARECTLETMRAIASAVPDLELEAFALGSMCFGVSGRCLLGHFVDGRSGNHGHCSQVCRLEWRAADGRYLGRLFSMKDLNLLPHLALLQDAGICAVKIEGRLKSPAWVACAVRRARAALQRADGTEDASLVADSQILFGRPDGPGYLFGETSFEALTCPDQSGHRGLKVPSFDFEEQDWKRYLRFRTPVDLSIRDGLCALSMEADKGAESFFSVAELLDAGGHPITVATQGTEVQVRYNGQKRPAALFIHSSALVEKRHLAGVPGFVPEKGAAPALVLDALTLTPETLTFQGQAGRLPFLRTYPLETEASRGAGLDPDLARKHLGLSFSPEATFTLAPGLFARPSLLKDLRRRLLEDLAAAWPAALGELGLSLTSAATAEGPAYGPTDSDLTKKKPACVSRVTGYPEGLVQTGGGRKFAILPHGGGTVVEDCAARGLEPEDLGAPRAPKPGGRNG
jgi:putative protease